MIARARFHQPSAGSIQEQATERGVAVSGETHYELRET